jgi:ribosomal protein S18 acetylase RimI-like enzyme
LSAPTPDLRPALALDLPALLAIHEAAFRELVEARFDWDPALQRQLFRAGDLGQVLELDGQVIGQWLVERRPDEVFLARVMLSPAWQGRGIATGLIRELQAEARAAGLPLTLQVWEENPARALYERLGFAVTGAREFRLQMRWLD